MTKSFPESNIGGVFYISDAISVTSYKTNIMYCYLCSEGSAFTLSSTSLTDSYSTYSNNAALYGGVYYVSSSSLDLTSVTVSNIYAV